MKSLLFFFSSFVSLCSIAQDSAIYVSDAGNWSNPPWQILKFDINGENPEVFIYEELAWPQDILFVEEEGEVLISNLNSGKITRYNGETGVYLGDLISGLAGPTRMKIGPDSLLYILQWNGDGKVKRYELNGSFVDDFTSSGVAQSIGLDWDSDTNLYVSSYNGRTVQKFDQNGVDQGIFIDTTYLQGPTNIWFDENGELLVADYNGTTVKRYDVNGQYQGEFLTGLGQSEGVDFLADQSILVGKGINGSVRRYANDGTFIEDLVAPGAGGLIRPNAVVVRDESTLGIKDYDNPNPNVTLTVQTDSAFKVVVSKAGNYEFIVSDVTGAKVYDAPFEEEIVWDPRTYVAGAYFITILSEDRRLLTKKVLVE